MTDDQGPDTRGAEIGAMKLGCGHAAPPEERRGGDKLRRHPAVRRMAAREQAKSALRVSRASPCPRCARSQQLRHLSLPMLSRLSISKENGKTTTLLRARLLGAIGLTSLTVPYRDAREPGGLRCFATGICGTSLIIAGRKR